MDYAILALIACCLGAGVAGGFLSAWSCHRRLLAIEENLKILFQAYDTRLAQIEKLLVRFQKQEAVGSRWDRAKAKDEALAQTLTQAVTVPSTHPWDPRTWGDKKG